MATTTETTREYVARHRYARITARKARLIADEIRGKDVNAALELLQFTPQRASAFYLKVLRSAIANATLEGTVNVNRLVVCDARADDGPMLQGRLRWHAGPQGRAMPFRKVTSHLTVKVRESEEAPRKKSKAKKSKAKQPTASAAAKGN
ncbi:MAG TPA: 50S ribosomal protein L22 [Planctomycetota bacterium]|nr:50S ribosomal protein L22 [Planctomycetota bacterium]